MVKLFKFLFALGWFFVSLELQAVVELQPHRAYYTITMLESPGPHSDISDVRGTMMLELRKDCGGWVVQQLSEVWRYQNDDSVDHMRWGYVTWEAFDGSRFDFNTFRKRNGELVEDIRGTVKRTGKLTQIIYRKPEQKTLNLPKEVLFPIQHTTWLLKSAQENEKTTSSEKGEHTFPAIVFDGSSFHGASEINTFVGTKKITTKDAAIADGHQFANQPFWPVRFAVYGFGDKTYEPLYVTTQELLPNGIIKRYIIYNDDVKILGVLERFELLSDTDS